MCPITARCLLARVCLCNIQLAQYFRYTLAQTDPDSHPLWIEPRSRLLSLPLNSPHHAHKAKARQVVERTARRGEGCKWSTHHFPHTRSLLRFHCRRHPTVRVPSDPPTSIHPPHSHPRCPLPRALRSSLNGSTQCTLNLLDHGKRRWWRCSRLPRLCCLLRLLQQALCSHLPPPSPCSNPSFCFAACSSEREAPPLGRGFTRWCVSFFQGTRNSLP